MKTVNCPHCALSLEVTPDMSGEFACPRCAGRFVLKGPEAPALAPIVDVRPGSRAGRRRRRVAMLDTVARPIKRLMLIATVIWAIAVG